MKCSERRQLAHWTVPFLGVVRDEMNETDTVCEPERGIPKSGGLNAVKLGERIADQLLVVRCPIGLDVYLTMCCVTREPPGALSDLCYLSLVAALSVAVVDQDESDCEGEGRIQTEHTEA
jgi:hypothetical protein